MGKAAEATDDLPVLARPLEIRIALEQPHCELLVLVRLAVLERQVDKRALVWRQALVPAALDDRARRFARERIGGKRARRAAEHVARELIEQDHQREAARGILAPGLQPAGGGTFIE